MKDLDAIVTVCDYHFSENWKDKSKRQEQVFERAIYYRLAKVLTNASLSKIGDMANRDHATVIHGLRIFHNDIQGKGFVSRHPVYYNLYRNLLKKCNRKISSLKRGELTKNEATLHENIRLRHENKKLKESLEIIKKSVA